MTTWGWLALAGTGTALGLAYTMLRKPSHCKPGARVGRRLRDLVGRGSRLTRSSWEQGTADLGFRSQSPQYLLTQAARAMDVEKADLNTYSLARMIRSEGSAEGRYRAHVALNDMKCFRYADNVHDLLTYSTDSKRRGLYGKQYSPAAPPTYPKANRRRYSTASDPYERDYVIAAQAIEDNCRGVDPTSGATKFLDIAAMARQKGSRGFQVVDAQWRRDGYTPFPHPTNSDFLLYRKAAC